MGDGITPTAERVCCLVLLLDSHVSWLTHKAQSMHFPTTRPKLIDSTCNMPCRVICWEIDFSGLPLTPAPRRCWVSEQARGSGRSISRIFFPPLWLSAPISAIYSPAGCLQTAGSISMTQRTTGLGMRSRLIISITAISFVQFETGQSLYSELIKFIFNVVKWPRSSLSLYLMC